MSAYVYFKGNRKNGFLFYYIFLKGVQPVPKFPLKYFIDHGNGNYENALEIPKYKKYKNKKAIKKLMAR